MKHKFPETRIVPPADPRKDTNALASDTHDQHTLLAAAQGIQTTTGLRSNTGAFIAVNCAMNALEHLAKTIQLCDYDLTNPKITARLAATLKADIADSWDSYTAMDRKMNPLNPKEAAQAAATRPQELYASTIACILRTDKYTAAACQGKGAILALDNKGHIFSLLPRDKLCLGRFTTTLADTDVFQRMRAAILPADIAAMLITTSTNQAEDLFLDLLTGATDISQLSLDSGAILWWADETKLKKLSGTLQLKVRLEQTERTQQELKTKIQEVRTRKYALDQQKTALQAKIFAIDEQQTALLDEKAALYHEIDKLYSQYSQLTRLEKQYQHDSQKQDQQRIRTLMLLNNS